MKKFFEKYFNEIVVCPVCKQKRKRAEMMCATNVCSHCYKGRKGWVNKNERSGEAVESIRTYTNTKCELEIAKARLGWLMDRKEQLYCKYFPITAKLKDDVISGGDKNNDKMDRYLSELYDVDIGTGNSLAAEIELQRALVERLNSFINEMTDALSRMSGIEYELYYEIVVNNKRVTRAVEHIAERYDLDTRTIWKYYYSKIKKDVENLLMYSESTVNDVVQCMM